MLNEHVGLPTAVLLRSAAKYSSRTSPKGYVRPAMT